jgi:[ribosomal protein S5]-alanine N-acetyltransferase
MILETSRLILRCLKLADAPFIRELVNDPDWLRFIGDRGVHSVDDARRFLREGPLAMYERHGIGLWRTELKDGGVPIGICGLLRRESLDGVDLGFALLPQFRAQGYAHEAAAGTLHYGRSTLGLDRILAITTPDNRASIGLLKKLGFRFENNLRLSDSDDAEELALFATD